MSNKILVVEDEPDLSLVIVERLKSAGYDVYSATNGKVALEQIKTNKPDLIISDVLMPELDGFGLFKALQQNPATAKIPVIILTARGKMSDTFTSIGVADFLAKPFDAQTLLATVAKHLSKETLRLTPTVEIRKPKQTTANKKALIAGDDAPTIALMSKQLIEKGYVVETTTDCLQVFSKIEEVLPNLFLLEIPTQDIAAKDVVNVIRGLPKTDKLPILLYSFQETAQGGTDDPRQKALSIDIAKEECLEAGANAYIGSITENSFIKSISKFL